MPYYTNISHNGPTANADSILGYQTRTIFLCRSGESADNLPNLAGTQNVVYDTLVGINGLDKDGAHPTIAGPYGSTYPFQPNFPAGFWKSGRTLRISGCLLISQIGGGSSQIDMRVGLNFYNSIGNVYLAGTLPVDVALPSAWVPFYFQYYMMCIGTNDPNNQYSTFDCYGTTHLNYKFDYEVANLAGNGSAVRMPNIEPAAVNPGHTLSFFPGDIQVPEVETQDTQAVIALNSGNCDIKLRHIIVEQLS
jgi:hypothetical protein